MNRRINNVRQTFDRLNVEAFLVTAPTNRRYLSGFTGSHGWLLITSTDQFILTDSRYTEQTKVECPSFTLYEDGCLVSALTRLTKQYDLKAIAVEAAHTSLHEHARRVEAMPRVTWISTMGEVEKERAIKDRFELERIEEAVALVDEAFTYIVDRLRGRTEKDVALDLESFLRRRGAEAMAFDPIVAGGPRAALPHARPTERTIGPGELVILDFGAVVDGYCSDMTRTVGIGPLDEKHRDVYAVVQEAQAAGVQAVRPGRTGREVDAVARDVIVDRGYGAYFGHGLGHGIGLDVHEDPPRLSRQSTSCLEAGMVCSVEPGVYLPEWGGVRIEDLVVVTKDGCRTLTSSTKRLLEM